MTVIIITTFGIESHVSPNDIGGFWRSFDANGSFASKLWRVGFSAQLPHEPLFYI